MPSLERMQQGYMDWEDDQEAYAQGCIANFKQKWKFVESRSGRRYKWIKKSSVAYVPTDHYFQFLFD